MEWKRLNGSDYYKELKTTEQKHLNGSGYYKELKTIEQKHLNGSGYHKELKTIDQKHLNGSSHKDILLFYSDFYVSGWLKSCWIEIRMHFSSRVWPQDEKDTFLSLDLFLTDILNSIVLYFWLVR